MVLCKFFAQGNCRFGENCRFEHDRSNASNYTSVLRQQSFVPNSNSNMPQTKTVDVNTLVQAVTNDMTQEEKGGQWIFSSYAPFKEKPLFPGFEDISFEEVRYGYYNAQRNGTVDQYLQELQATSQKTISMIKTLQNPNTEIIALITQIYNSPPGTSSTAFINSNPSQGLQSTAFNQATPTGNTNSIFAQPNSNNLFAQNNQPSGGNSIFAQANQQLFNNSNVAGVPQSTSSIFGNTVLQQQQSSGFGPTQATPPVPTNNAFSFMKEFQQQPPQTSVSAIQSPFTNNIFVGSPPIPNSNNSPFFNDNQTSQFGTIPQQMPQTLNNQPPGTGGIFFNSSNNAATAPTSTVQQSSIFGAPPVQSGIGNNSLVTVDEKNYSKLEDLTEDEINSFKSEKFVKGNIPEKPPTREMCF